MSLRWLSVLLLVCALVATLALVLTRPGERAGLTGALDGLMLDARFRFRGPVAPPTDILIVEIDDQDIEMLGQFPPPRSALAEVVGLAAEQGAAAVAIDILLLGPTPDDAALAEAIAGYGRTVLATARPPAASSGRDIPNLRESAFGVLRDVPTVSSSDLAAPGPDLTRDALMGHVEVALDGDGALRRLPAAAPAQGSETDTLWLPSLALSTLRAATGLDATDLELDLGNTPSVRVGNDTRDLDAQGQIPLVFYGPQGVFDTVSLRALPDAPLNGRIILIGSTATGVGDAFTTPFDPALPGVEAHATLLGNMLDGSSLTRTNASAALGMILALVAAILAFLAASRAGPWIAAGLLVTVTGASAVAVQAAFLAGWWLDSVGVLGGLVFGGLAGVMARLIANRRRAENLARFHSPFLVNTLAESGAWGSEPREQTVAALFVDVAGFTARSEALGPKGTAEFLRAFHTRVETAALEHRGVIQQYAGDGVMLIFGLPDPAPDDAVRAINCAETLLELMAELSLTEQAAGRAPVGVRIGGHVGPVVAGLLGGTQQRQATVAGDVVNTASRLQGLAREIGADLVVSETLLIAAGNPGAMAARLSLKDHGARSLRDRSEPVSVWARPAFLNA